MVKPIVVKEVSWHGREVQFLHNPLKYGPFVYRFRMPAPHAGEAGSIPARAAEMTKWRNWKTRDAQNVVPVRAWEFKSPLGH